MVNSIRKWGEVAPILLQSHYKRSSLCSKLEPIMEEESPQRVRILNKSVFVSMPLLLSGFLYIFLYRGAMMIMVVNDTILAPYMGPYYVIRINS
ncbi:hypothetical protein VNO78_03121 [Psophocarpus tetragonolobus]|uniref:Uncharacterized protein n=1 Tax=Psophocarpus tetragonolobus TaxID=3891 RepID=A0AAN9T1K3_PSOTE